MIIHDIHISGFGRHRDLDLHLSGKLTVIMGDNESGKSTVMAFLRTMFYGFGRRHQTFEKDRRRRYTPWHQADMGGRVRFTHEGIAYRLERRFGHERADDRTALFLDRTGEPVFLSDPERPGVSLLGLSEAEFVNTIFAGQSEAAVDAVPDLTARLFDDASGTFGAAAVRKHLTDAKHALTGRRGRLAVLEASYAAASESYSQAASAAAEKAAAAAQIERLSERMAAIDAQLEAERHRADTEAAFDLLEREAEVLALDDEAIDEDMSPHRIEITPLGEDITIRALSELSDRHQSLVQQQTAIEQLYGQLDNRVDELHRLERDYDALADAGRTAARKLDDAASRPMPPRPVPNKTAAIGLSVLAGIGLLLAAIALVSGSRHASFGWLLGTGVAVLLVGGAGLFFDMQRQEQAAKKHRAIYLDLRRRRSEAERQINEIQSLQQQVAGYYQNAKRIYDGLLRQVHDEEDKHAAAVHGVVQELQPYCGRLAPEDIGFAITRLRQQMITPADMARAQKYRALMQNATPEHFRQQIADAKAKLLEDGIDPADFRQAKQQFLATYKHGLTQEASDALAAERAALAAERQEMTSALSWLGKDLDSPEEWLRRLRAMDAEREQINALADAVERAAGWLETAVNDMDAKLAPRLNELASFYLAAMTADKYKKVFIDRSFTVHVESEDGLLREEAAFSGATVDQIDLALRLALSTIISVDTDRMPLFLDETLSQLDAERLSQTLAMLAGETSSGGRQIVYLTSDRRVADAVGAAGDILVLD